MDLSKKKCKPCEGGVEPFDAEKIKEYIAVVPGWSVSEDALSIHRKYTFKNFAEALAFVNRVGVIAEDEGHHPDITFGWGRAEITLTTHAIRGLSENDFIVAFKIDQYASHVPS